ncbi:hypothetical protein ABFS82_11G106100 [Erythranthe guttata]
MEPNSLNYHSTHRHLHQKYTPLIYFHVSPKIPFNELYKIKQSLLCETFFTVNTTTTPPSPPTEPAAAVLGCSRNCTPPLSFSHKTRSRTLPQLNPNHALN